jgi:hypothetical protein
VREHFRHEPYYVDLVELLHETRHPAFFRNPVPVSAFFFKTQAAVICRNEYMRI